MAASRLWRDARKYEAQPVSSCRNCLKYMPSDPPSPTEAQWYGVNSDRCDISPKGSHWEGLTERVPPGQVSRQGPTWEVSPKGPTWAGLLERSRLGTFPRGSVLTMETFGRCDEGALR